MSFSWKLLKWIYSVLEKSSSYIEREREEKNDFIFVWNIMRANTFVGLHFIFGQTTRLIIWLFLAQDFEWRLGLSLLTHLLLCAELFTDSLQVLVHLLTHLFSSSAFPNIWFETLVSIFSWVQESGKFFMVHNTWSLWFWLSASYIIDFPPFGLNKRLREAQK